MIRSLVVLPDGKILAAGRGELSRKLLRLNDDGTIDPTFRVPRMKVYSNNKW
jgi:hypothetical protein